MSHVNNDDEQPFDVEGYLNKAHKDAYRGDAWEMVALILLVIIVAAMFFSGIRGVILAIVWIVAVAFLLRVRRGIFVLVTILAALSLTGIGIFVLFQAV